MFGHLMRLGDGDQRPSEIEATPALGAVAGPALVGLLGAIGAVENRHHIPGGLCAGGGARLRLLGRGLWLLRTLLGKAAPRTLARILRRYDAMAAIECRQPLFNHRDLVGSRTGALQDIECAAEEGLGFWFPPLLDVEFGERNQCIGHRAAVAAVAIDCQRESLLRQRYRLRGLPRRAPFSDLLIEVMALVAA